MDAAEIARLREIAESRPKFTTIKLAKLTLRSLLDELEQARRELAGARDEIQGWHELWGDYDKNGNDPAVTLAERDSARALLRESSIYVNSVGTKRAIDLSARIDAELRKP